MTHAEKLRWRAEQFTRLRSFLSDRGAIEATVPVLFPEPATDPDIEVPRVTNAAQQPIGYLHSSPEFALKRLVADSKLDLFSLGSVFRLDESSPRHALEFTMLEWYRVGWTHTQLMDEVAELLQSVLGAKPVEMHRYKDAFKAALGVCPLAASDSEIQALLPRVGYQGSELSRDGALQLLCALEVERNLGQGTVAFLTDYPPGQAALARHYTDAEGQQVAARFEVFVDSVELANGYWELTDPAEQRARMQADLAQRSARGLPAVPIDEAFIAALSDLPECAGVALGVDRLLMLALGAADIQSTRLF